MALSVWWRVLKKDCLVWVTWVTLALQTVSCSVWLILLIYKHTVWSRCTLRGVPLRWVNYLWWEMWWVECQANCSWDQQLSSKLSTMIGSALSASSNPTWKRFSRRKTEEQNLSIHWVPLSWSKRLPKDYLKLAGKAMLLNSYSFSWRTSSNHHLLTWIMSHSNGSVKLSSLGPSRVCLRDKLYVVPATIWLR